MNKTTIPTPPGLAAAAQAYRLATFKVFAAMKAASRAATAKVAEVAP